MTKALLLLEDGSTYVGTAIGAPGTTVGQVVFATAMTGYQEMLTDPSYAGQLLTLTYPLIGNYGVAEEDFESRGVQVAGFVIRELCDAPSHWRLDRSSGPVRPRPGGGSLDEFLRRHDVPGIQGIDTRALTRRLRVHGVMMGILTSELTHEEALARLQAAPPYDAIDFVRRVSTNEPYVWGVDDTHGSQLQVPGAECRVPSAGSREPGAGSREPGAGSAPKALRVALVDCGVKYNIMRRLASFGCETTVLPCTMPAEAILEREPDGIAFSPGPGDPALLGYVVETARKLIGKKPLFGICLGNQILGCAFGATTFKLPFGHRGGNHPVKELETGRVVITSQNHGYAVDPKGLEGTGMEVTHVNLNDGTVEGLRHRELPIFTIQYHPEASPGPRDSDYLFDRFVSAMRKT